MQREVQDMLIKKNVLLCKCNSNRWAHVFESQKKKKYVTATNAILNIVLI